MDSIEIKQLESSGITMIVAYIPKAQFISYRLNSPEDIGIYVETVSTDREHSERQEINHIPAGTS